jgi:hypothetical protein
LIAVIARDREKPVGRELTRIDANQEAMNNNFVALP